MTSAFDIGDRRRFKASFKDDKGVPANPSLATVTVRAPDGTITNPTLINDGVGEFHVDISFDISGRWIIRIIGTGNVESVEETEVWIRKIRA